MPLRTCLPHRDRCKSRLVDFVDDALGNPDLTVANINDMMAKLRTAGASDVSWGYYADAKGGQLMPNTGWTGNVRTVFGRLGNPSAEAMEIFAAKNKVIIRDTTEEVVQQACLDWNAEGLLTPHRAKTQPGMGRVTD